MFASHIFAHNSDKNSSLQNLLFDSRLLYMVVECGRRFKSDLQSLEASLRYLSPLLEIDRFTS